MKNPRRGEIWLIDFEPQEGAEIMKKRPGIVISMGFDDLPIRIVVPIREHHRHHTAFFFIKLVPGQRNGLKKISSADCSQVKSFDLSRFDKRIGRVSDVELNNVVDAVAVAIGA